MLCYLHANKEKINKKQKTKNKKQKTNSLKWGCFFSTHTRDYIVSFTIYVCIGVWEST